MTDSKKDQPTQKNVYQRINSVMREAEYLQKKDAQQGKGVRYDEVAAMLRVHLINHGLVLVVRQTKFKCVGNVEGTKQKVYQGSYEMDIVNIDSPDDKITYYMQAHGMDGGDKAPGKAHTYAVKVMLVKAFFLETGEDEESRDEKAKRAEAETKKRRQPPGKGTKQWENAKAAYLRDGNLDKVRARVDISDDLAAELISEAKLGQQQETKE